MSKKPSGSDLCEKGAAKCGSAALSGVCPHSGNDVTPQEAAPDGPRKKTDDVTLEKVVYGVLEKYFNKLQGELPHPGLYKRVIREVERPLFFLTLKAASGNQQLAAAILGINRNTLRKKMIDVSKNKARSANLKVVAEKINKNAKS
ncbi:MAG: hypothetical protein LBF72_00130 [Holosporales bacterium]|nr:hypothetical protein [Holosporales bacterium]